MGTADQGLCSTNRFKLKSIPKSEAGCVPYGLLSAAYKQLLDLHTGLHIGFCGNPLTGLQPSVADWLTFGKRRHPYPWGIETYILLSCRLLCRLAALVDYELDQIWYWEPLSEPSVESVSALFRSALHVSITLCHFDVYRGFLQRRLIAPNNFCSQYKYIFY